jgi:hypothetical protein
MAWWRSCEQSNTEPGYNIINFRPFFSRKIGFARGDKAYLKRKSTRLPRGIWDQVAKRVKIDDGIGGTKTGKQLSDLLDRTRKEQAWNDAHPDNDSESDIKMCSANGSGDEDEDGDDGGGGDDGDGTDHARDIQHIFVRNVPVRLESIIRDNVDSKALNKCLDRTKDQTGEVVAAVADVIGAILYQVTLRAAHGLVRWHAHSYHFRLAGSRRTQRPDYP